MAGVTAGTRATWRCPAGHVTTQDGLARPPIIVACRELIAARTECGRTARLVTFRP